MPAVRYMLDTNVLIHAMCGTDEALLARLEACLAGELVLSAMRLRALARGIMW